ncbi:MAG: thiamine diphosphokinase [Firmicutes bacterium]|nr:thiamine diphosphokinase [Bacillota bacterium]
MEKRCFIFGAGEFETLREKPVAGDIVIAADGGQALCEALGVEPTLVIGDFDSSPEPMYETDVIILPVVKDDTDMIYSIKHGLSEGCREFHIYGGTGGRLDHTVANLQSLLYIANRGARGCLYGADTAATVIKDGTFTFKSAGMVSVFAFGGSADGVTIRGGQYEVEGISLTPEFPLGVSNHSTGNPVTVTVERGALLVMWEDI